MDKAARNRVRDELLHRLAGPKVLIMGILNVTPDSFSDGGRHDGAAAAIAHAAQMKAEGADIVDMGGESTRPGAELVSADEEWARVSAAIEALATEDGLPVSIDTYKASVARRAAEAFAMSRAFSAVTFT